MKAKINGINMYFEDHGAGDPVLFVHGFPLSGKLWEPVIEPLAASHRLIIPDLRGLGQSEVSSETDLGTYADDLAALLDELEESKPAVVVGMSMGGYVAFEFYRRHRDRVRALVLVDTRAEPDTPEARQDRELTAETVLADGPGNLAENLVDKLFGRKASDSLREQWQDTMAASPPEGVAAALRAMAARPDSTAILPELDVPVLIVVGEQDALTPPSVAEGMKGAIPNAQLVVLPDAGHMSPAEQPAGFVEALRSFLGSLS